MAEMRQKRSALPDASGGGEAPEDEPGAHLGMMLLPAGTYLPISLRRRINSTARKGVARVLTILDLLGVWCFPASTLVLYRSATSLRR